MRQSVSLPAKVASQVRIMAKSRRLSATRLLVELIENGLEAEQRKQQAFLTWPSASAMKPTRKQQSVWAINWDTWFLAVDAKDRTMGEFPGGRWAASD